MNKRAIEWLKRSLDQNINPIDLGIDYIRAIELTRKGFATSNCLITHALALLVERQLLNGFQLRSIHCFLGGGRLVESGHQVLDFKVS